MDDKRSTAMPILAAILMLLVVVLGAYVGAYVLRGAYVDESNSYWAIRVFATDTEGVVFSTSSERRVACKAAAGKNHGATRRLTDQRNNARGFGEPTSCV
jgi:hypothetical protein